MFTNIEGRVQECRKASYPPNEAKEDWQIFNLISKNLHNNNLFSDLFSIRNIILKNIPNFSEIDYLPIKNIKNETINLNSTGNEKIILKPIDYYFSNSIARASKTMSDCRNILLDIKKNGTNN